MPSSTDWKERLRHAFESAHVPDDDVLDELAQHAETLYETTRTEGCSHEQACGEVERQIQIWRRSAAELSRPSRGSAAIEHPGRPSPLFTGIGQDIIYALRVFQKELRFALLAVATMAAGIGATTTLFSLTYGVLVKPLPWPNGERLVQLKETRGGRLPRFGAFSSTEYLAWRDQKQNVEEIAAWSQRNVTLASPGEPGRMKALVSTASLFRVLGTPLILGGPFLEKDETEHVLLISKSLWRDRFGSDPDVLGKAMQMDGQAYTVKGVFDDAAAYPNQDARLWIPMRIRAGGNLLAMFNAVALLRPGATKNEAAREATDRGRFVADTGLTTTAIFGSNGPVQVSAQPLRTALGEDVRRPLFILLTAVSLLFAAGTANIASLQLARATSRRREMAIRAALGASTGRVLRQLLVENMLIGIAGGGIGTTLSYWLHASLPALLPADFPRLYDLTFNTGVVIFALVCSVAASTTCGFLPALYVSRLDLKESLSEDAAAAVGTREGSRSVRLRMGITASQVAIACMLLVGASLLVRSFVALVNVDRGYTPSGVLIAGLSLTAPQYTAETRYRLMDDILGKLETLPDITEVSFTSELPLAAGGSTAAMTLKAQHGNEGVITAQASPRIVSPDYFSAMRIRIVQGRGFDKTDIQTSLPVAVVNRSFARRYLGDSPIGAAVPMGVGYQDTDTTAAVIGVIDDIRYLSPLEPTQPEIYYSYLQLRRRLAVPVVTLVVHSKQNPVELISSVRAAIRETDHTLAPDYVSAMEQRVSQGLARPRLYAVLLGSLAILAVTIAGVGLFAVLSFLVSQRRRELAVHAALGASQLDLVRKVLRQGMRIASLGLACGLIGSVTLARSLSAMLYGVTPADTMSYAAVSTFLLLITVLACLGPALRAARIDPIQVLKA